MRAIHENGAVRTVFTVQAEDPETEAAIAARMGARTCAETLEEGVLGHEGHGPLDEELYCAGRWESECSEQTTCPELPLQAA